MVAARSIGVLAMATMALATVGFIWRLRRRGWYEFVTASAVTGQVVLVISFISLESSTGQKLPEFALQIVFMSGCLPASAVLASLEAWRDVKVSLYGTQRSRFLILVVLTLFQPVLLADASFAVQALCCLLAITTIGSLWLSRDRRPIDRNASPRPINARWGA